LKKEVIKNSSLTDEVTNAIDHLMKNFFTKKNIFFRFQQLLILLLHFILLKWIIFTLNQAGLMSMSEVIFHFTGMAIFGGLLIFGCAKWARFHYLKEIEIANS